MIRSDCCDCCGVGLSEKSKRWVPDVQWRIISEIYGQSTDKETERLANEASVTELTLSLNRGILSKGDPVFNCGVTLDSLNPFSRGGIYS